MNRALLPRALSCALFEGPWFFECVMARLDNGEPPEGERPGSFWRDLVAGLALTPQQEAFMSCAHEWWSARSDALQARRQELSEYMVAAPRESDVQAEAVEELQKVQMIYKMELVSVEALMHATCLSARQIAQVVIGVWPRCDCLGWGGGGARRGLVWG